VKYWNPELFRHDEDPMEYLQQLKEELQELPDIPHHYLPKRKNDMLYAIESLIEKEQLDY
jgi:hypothetical protein